jgi:paraquat-inducible protein B
VSRLASVLWPWVVPLLALGIATYLMARDTLDAGPTLRLRLEHNPGLEPGQAELRHRGVRCGTVRTLALVEDMAAVEAEVELEASCAQLTLPGSEFWVVKPEIGWDRIRGLETLRSGPYIAGVPPPGDVQRPSTADTPRSFEVRSAPPPRARRLFGQRVLVSADDAQQIDAGSPVYHRGVEVGHVEDLAIAENGHDVVFALFIERRYVPLVRARTTFWPVTGLSADVGLFGAEIRAGSLESFFGGGVAFATPEGSPPLAPGTQFRLADAPPDDWRAWAPDVRLDSTEPAHR